MTKKASTKTIPNTPAPAQTETIADVSAQAAATAAAQAATPASVDVEPVVATVEVAPLAGAGDGDSMGDFLPPAGDQYIVTHTISAVPEKGFCRAGARWHREPTYVNRDDWTDEQWIALTSEPNLSVTELAQ